MRALLATALMAGCTGSGGPDTASDTAAEGFRQPVSFSVSGAFGYDPEAGTALAYRLGPGEVPLQPWVEIRLTTASADGGDQSECVAAIRHDLGEPDLGAAPWAGEVWWGTELPAGSPGGGSCLDLDPAVWGQNPALTLAEQTWGLGVGELDQDVRDALFALNGDTDWDTHWEPYLVGGRFGLPGSAELETRAYAFGYVVDEQMTVQWQEPPQPSPAMHAAFADAIGIEAAEVEAASTLPRGMYVVLGEGVFDPELLLP